MNVYASLHADAGALRRRVVAWCVPFGDEPLGQAGVEAAGDRVFADAVAVVKEEAHLNTGFFVRAVAPATGAALPEKARASRLERTMSPTGSVLPFTLATPTPVMAAPCMAARSWTKSGARSSTRCGLSSNSPKWLGPLFRCWLASTAERGRPSASASACTNAGVASLRRSIGAANEERAPFWRMLIRPTSHSCTTMPGVFGTPPCSSQAWQLPSVGWPANGISYAVVKMRTW